VMMRGRKVAAVAVRNPTGDIVVHQEPLTAAVYTRAWSRWPFVRGLSLLWDALVLGTRALMWSADVALSEEEEDVQFTGPVGWATVGVSLILAMGLFFFVPATIGKWLETTLNASVLTGAIIEGLARLALFLLYLFGIGQMNDIRRVFQYHGAEHKTINAYEAGVELTPPEVARFSVQHPRCGTSFLLVVLVLSIILFAPLHFNFLPGGLGYIARLLSRLLLIPVVAGISYEFLRFTANNQDKAFIRMLTAPGLALQRMTTREPAEDMLECAIAALTPVLQADGIDAPNYQGKPFRVVNDREGIEEAIVVV